MQVWTYYNEGRAHYVMVFKVQWKPFWLGTQPYPKKDWTGWHVNHDVFAHAPLAHMQSIEAPESNFDSGACHY